MDPLTEAPAPIPFPAPAGGQRVPLGAGMAGALGLDAAAFDPYAPKYPAWFYKTVNRDLPDGSTVAVRELAPPKEPDAKQFQDWIQNDALLYGELLRRFEADLRDYGQLVQGVPRDFDPDLETAFVSSEATVQVNKVAAMVATAPVRVRYAWRTAAEREAAARMEQFARWFLAQWATHHRAGNSDLKWDMGWYSLVYGRIAAQVGPDLEDGDFPWWVELLDPATCYPVWGKGKHGMVRMSRRFTASVGEVLDEFDPTGEHGLVRKLEEKSGLDTLDLTRDATVESCTTRWHRFTQVDGVQVELVAHERGHTGYVYNLAPGEAGSSAAPGALGSTGLSPTDITRRGYGSEGGSSRQRDMARKGQSFYHPIRQALRQREKVLALSMIFLDQTINPPTVDTYAGGKPPAPLDLTPGARNKRHPGQQTVPAIPVPRPFDASTVLAELNTELRKGLLPDVIFGQTEGSNITGFASDSLMAAAKDRIAPYFANVQTTVEDILALAALDFRNFGWAAEGLPGGVLVIPRANRGGGFVSGMKPAPAPPWAAAIVNKLMTSLAGPGMPGPDGQMLPGTPESAIGVPGVSLPEWTLPAMPAEDEPEVRIDRETIDMVPARPAVSLETLGLNNRTVLINYLTQAVNAKVMRRSTAMEELPEVEDALAELEGILAEDAMTDPEMLRRVNYPRALARQGDLDGFLTYWGTVLLPEIVQAMAPMLAAVQPGAAQQQPQPPGQAQGGPGNGRTPIPQPSQAGGAVNGQNPAAVGQGPGSNGQPVGRPY